METPTLEFVAASLSDAVWPARCPLCDASDHGDGLGCAEHRFETGLPGSRCGRCAAAVASMLADGERCPECRARGPGFARVAALGAYRNAANAEWLLALKYGGRGDLAWTLGVLLAARLALEPEDGGSSCVSRPNRVGTDRSAIDGPSAPRILVPVPLHIARRIERGYDQSALLAEACAAEAGLPAIHALRRTRATTVQGALGTTSRAANVRGAFAPSYGARFHARRIAGADVWLVDDVLTSGSTASECARILRRLGARRVSVLCVARP